MRSDTKTNSTVTVREDHAPKGTSLGWQELREETSAILQSRSFGLHEHSRLRMEALFDLLKEALAHHLAANTLARAIATDQLNQDPYSSLYEMCRLIAAYRHRAGYGPSETNTHTPCLVLLDALEVSDRHHREAASRCIAWFPQQEREPEAWIGRVVGCSFRELVCSEFLRIEFVRQPNSEPSLHLHPIPGSAVLHDGTTSTSGRFIWGKVDSSHKEDHFSLHNPFLRDSYFRPAPAREGCYLPLSLSSEPRSMWDVCRRYCESLRLVEDRRIEEPHVVALRPPILDAWGRPVFSDIEHAAAAWTRTLADYESSWRAIGFTLQRDLIADPTPDSVPSKGDRLSRLIARRRAPGPNEVPLTIPAIDGLLSEPLLSEGALSDQELARRINPSQLEPTKQFIDSFLEWPTLLEAGAQILVSLTPKGAVDHMITCSYDQTGICGSDGLVVFESLGHLLAFTARYLEDLRSARRESLSADAKGARCWSELTSAFDALCTCAVGAGVIGEKERESLTRRRSGVRPEVHIDTRVGGLSRARSLLDGTFEQMRARVSAVFVQTCGALPRNAAEVHDYLGRGYSTLLISTPDRKYSEKLGPMIDDLLLKGGYAPGQLDICLEILDGRRAGLSPHWALSKLPREELAKFAHSFPTLHRLLFPRRKSGDSPVTSATSIDALYAEKTWASLLGINVSWRRRAKFDALQHLATHLREAAIDARTRISGIEMPSIPAITDSKGYIVFESLDHLESARLAIDHFLTTLASGGRAVGKASAAKNIRIEGNVEIFSRPRGTLGEYARVQELPVMFTPTGETAGAIEAAARCALRAQCTGFGAERLDDFKRSSNRLRHLTDGGEVAVQSEKMSKKLGPRAEPDTENLYRTLFTDLNVPLSTLFFARCALGELPETAESIRGVRDLIERSVRDRPKEVRDREVRESAVSLFARLIDSHSLNLKRDGLSELGKTRLVDLLYQICIRRHRGGATAVMRELNDVRQQTNSQGFSRVARSLLKEVVPALLTRLEERERFSVPQVLKFSPFPSQRDAAVASLYHERPILIMGPGTGKTETALLIASAGGYSRTLWVTKAGLRSDAVRRISSSIQSRVVNLTPETMTSDPDEFRTALGPDGFAVVSYDTLRSAFSKTAENCTTLRGWIADGLKVLDEAHLIDNATSARFRTLHSIPSARTLLLTGTPVQHRPERTTALLALAFPERYSDPLALRREFKSDPEWGRAVFHEHTVLETVEESALSFRPFSEISAKEQLASEVPHVPRLVVEKLPVTLSPEHSLLYAELMTNFDQWAERTNQRRGALAQLCAVNRLVSNPERLGASPPEALLSRVEELIVSAADKGEKVLVLGRGLSLLKMLHDRAPLLTVGCELLSGCDSPSRRAAQMKRLEDDPHLSCVIGQIGAVGSGYNCRGVKHVVFVDIPNLTADLIQGMGRHRRILTRGMERWAHEAVHVWIVEPHLDRAAISTHSDPEQRQKLLGQSVYSRWADRALARVDEYRLLTSRRSRIAVNKVDSIRETVSELANLHRALEKERKDYSVMNQYGLGDEFFRYRTPAKVTWRTRGIGDFLQKRSGYMRSPIQGRNIALLPGPEALEIEVYREAGVPVTQIYGFEGSAKRAVREKAERAVTGIGAWFSGERIETALPKADKSFGIVSIDTDGHIRPSFVELFSEARFDDDAIIILNAVCGRESGPAKKLLSAAHSKRKRLQRELISLAGSRIHSRLKLNNPIDTFRAAATIRDTVRSIAKTLDFESEERRERFMSNLFALAIDGYVILETQTTSYRSLKGSRLLSTFAHIARPSLNAAMKSSLSPLIEMLRADVHSLDLGESKVESLVRDCSLVIRNQASRESLLTMPLSVLESLGRMTHEADASEMN